MELSCPNCHKKLNIPDQYVGQLMRCPLCNGTFQTPPVAGGQATLPPVPMEAAAIPEPPPPPREGFSTEPIRSQRTPHDDVVYATEEATPARPTRDYIRCCTVHFRLPIVTWIAPAALLLVFLFSFLPWFGLFIRGNVDGLPSTNAWSIGFGHGGDGLTAIFDIFMVLALVASIPSALITVNVIPVPRGLRLWRAVILAAIVGLAFVFLFIRYIDITFRAYPITIWPKLVWRLMFIATLTSVMEIWLELRRAKGLPPPKIECYR